MRMSRPQSGPYYRPVQPPPPPSMPPPGQGQAYYSFEDTEGYVGDYSESDCISEPNSPRQVRLVQRNPADVTELYRRKQVNPAASRGPYRQNVYIPSEFYYDQPPGFRMQPQQPLPPQPVSPVYQRKMMAPPKYFTADDMAFHRHQQEQFQQATYHASLPHVAAIPRQPLQVQRAPSATVSRVLPVQGQQGAPPQMVRRHPVTVRTPRYVRRPSTTSSIFKRPSTLCIPIACQPDPGMVRKPRRSPCVEEPGLYVSPSKTANRRQAQPPGKEAQDTRKSIDMSKTRLDAILERYERIFGTGAENEGTKFGQDFAKSMEPRERQGVKVEYETPKQEQQQPKGASSQSLKQQMPEIIRNAETFEVEEITSDVLDELLSELTENGLNDSAMRLQKTGYLSPTRLNTESPGKKIVAEKCTAELTTTANNSNTDVPTKENCQEPSFNYQEIKKGLEKLQKSKQQATSACGSETDASHKSQKQVPIICHHRRHGKRLDNSTQSSVANLHRSTSTCPKLNQEDVMELHRTKSYVVNLIDTALSNHFGTSAMTCCGEKNCSAVRSAVEMLRKHSSAKIDKELCLEIAQALTDSFVSNSALPSEKKSNSVCTCKSQIDEPLFVKQLKQMRWGHLKHIQREVRRLEDLERFLDSCSNSNFGHH